MPSSPRLNVLLIVIDAGRADRFGCYGYRRGTTPTADGLAQEGSVFDRMIAPAPWTLPSHASLFTGLYSREHGADRPGFKMRSGVLTLAQHLERAGYATAFVSNNPLVSRRTGVVDGAGQLFLRRAFDSDYRRGWVYRLKAFAGRSDSGAAAANRLVTRLFTEVGGPFFIFVNYMECHWKYSPPRSYERRFVRRPYSSADSALFRLRTRHRYSWDDELAGDGAALELLSDLYDASLACVDDRLGDLLSALERSGRADETVVIVTADHGESIGDHGLTGHGTALYQELLRVPFIVRIPGRAPARVSGLVQLTDVFAGLCGLLDIEIPEPLRDRRFSADPFALAPGAPGREFAFAELHPLGGDALARRLQRRLARVPNFRPASEMEAVQDDRYKFTVEPESGRESLFDLRADPGERRNQIEALPDERRRLARALEQWRAEFQPAGVETALTAEDERILEARLRGLGYL